MTTERKRAANRVNARLSTGPRTAAGQARVKQNALRHGLNIAVANDPLLTAVFNEMDSEAELVWRRSTVPAQREDAWMRVTVGADIRARLNRAIEDLKFRELRNRKLKLSTD